MHDIVVELERDALLYPFLNEPSGDSGNSVLIFGSALHNAELALLMAVCATPARPTTVNQQRETHTLTQDSQS